MSSLPESSDIWTRYWQGGVLHSCGCAFAGNYEGAIADFWRARFAALPSPAVLVDVGTGNGALPLLARELARERSAAWQIHGVDLADIDPPARSDDRERYAGVQFHPRTSVTALPFADGSVDLVTGQYALEYTPIETAVAEIARVLDRGRTAAFVLHSADSVVLAAAPPQLDNARLLLEDSEFFHHARTLAAMLAAAPTPQARQRLAADPRAEAARRRFNRATTLLSQRIAESGIPDLLQTALGQTGAALQRAHLLGPQKTLAYLDSCEQALRDEALRLRDLVAAALDPQAAEALRRRFLKAGFNSAELGRLEHAPGQPMGWILVAQR